MLSSLSSPRTAGRAARRGRAGDDDPHAAEGGRDDGAERVTGRCDGRPEVGRLLPCRPGLRTTLWAGALAFVKPASKIPSKNRTGAGALAEGTVKRAYRYGNG